MQVRIHTNAREIAQTWRTGTLGIMARILDAMRRILTAFGREAVYPPPPAKPSYQRTFTMLRGLQPGGYMNVTRAELHGFRVTGEYGTNVDYSSYVIGTPETGGRQARAHRGYWWTLADKWREFAPKAPGVIQQAVTEHLQRLVH